MTIRGMRDGDSRSWRGKLSDGLQIGMVLAVGHVHDSQAVPAWQEACLYIGCVKKP